MNIFDLMAKIGMDSSEYESGLDKASGLWNGFTDKIQSAAGIASNVASAIGTTISNAAKTFTAATGEVAAYGDSIDKASQKLGVSRSFYQEWEAVLQHSGTSMGSMTATFKTLANASQGASKEQEEAFARLGLSMEAVSKMSSEELFQNVIFSMQQLEEGTERTAIATTLLGKGAMELGPLLNTSAEDTQAMIDTVNELGGVMSDDAVMASAAYQDALQDMTTAIDGVKRNLTSEFLPSVTSVMNGITALATGDESGIEVLSEAVSGLITKFTTVGKKVSETFRSMLPTVLKAAGEMANSLIEGLVTSLPEIATAALELVESLSYTIIENLPALIDTAVQIIFAIVSGLTAAAPELIPAIVEAVMLIADTLTNPDTLVSLVEAATTLIIALSEGMMYSLPQLLQKSNQIVTNIADAIIKALPLIFDAGIQVLAMILSGALLNMGDLLDFASQVIFKIVEGLYTWGSQLYIAAADGAQQIVDGFSGIIQAAKTWGKDLIDNFIGGIKSKWEDLKGTVSGFAQTIQDYIGFSEPKKGPLSNFHTYAPDMMQLFAKGIEDNERLITAQFNESLSVMANPSNVPYSTAQNVSGGNTINLYVDIKADADFNSLQFVETVQDALSRLDVAQITGRGGVAV